MKKTVNAPVVSVNGNGEALDVRRLSREEVATASEMSRFEARALVGMYSNIQKIRVGARNRESAHERHQGILSDPRIIVTLKEQLQLLEKQAERGLEKFVKRHIEGRWLLSIAGVGPIIAAGLMAHIDITRCCCPNYQHFKGLDRRKIPAHKCPGLTTAGRILSFAGMLDPRSYSWEKGERRPYNVRLKNLCYQMWTSWKRMSVPEGEDDETLAEKIKLAASKKKMKLTDEELLDLVEAKREGRAARAEDLEGEKCLYIRLYMARKEQEVRRNERGDFKDLALERLRECKAKRIPITTGMRKKWESGKLQNVGLDRRAGRFAVKILISHYHQVAYETHFGKKPPVPYVIGKLEHIDYINIPNWPLKE